MGPSSIAEPGLQSGLAENANKGNSLVWYIRELGWIYLSSNCGNSYFLFRHFRVSNCERRKIFIGKIKATQNHFSLFARTAVKCWFNFYSSMPMSILLVACSKNHCWCGKRCKYVGRQSGKNSNIRHTFLLGLIEICFERDLSQFSRAFQKVYIVNI